MKTTALPQDYALVLAQIGDAGREDFTSLAETLRFDSKRLAHIIKALQHKGLILVRQADYSDMWIRLSRRGQRLMANMWPESQGLPQAI